MSFKLINAAGLFVSTIDAPFTFAEVGLAWAAKCGARRILKKLKANDVNVTDVKIVASEDAVVRDRKPKVVKEKKVKAPKAPKLKIAKPRARKEKPGEFGFDDSAFTKVTVVKGKAIKAVKEPKAPKVKAEKPARAVKAKAEKAPKAAKVVKPKKETKRDKAVAQAAKLDVKSSDSGINEKCSFCANTCKQNGEAVIKSCPQFTTLKK